MTKKIPSNEEIYDKAMKDSPHIATHKQIALSAMFDLRKLMLKATKMNSQELLSDGHNTSSFDCPKCGKAIKTVYVCPECIKNAIGTINQVLVK